VPVVPFRVFGDVARRKAVAVLGASARNSRLVQSSEPVAVSPLLVLRSRFAVSHFLGYAVFLRRTVPATVKRPVHPLYEFRVPPASSSTSPSRSAAADRLLSWAFAPYSTSGIGGPLAAGGAAARYVPPSGFGYPLGGLRPPSPCRLSFTPAALMGFALRSLLLPKGIRRVSARKNPRAVPTVGIPAAEAEGRPNGPRLLGHTLPEVPGARRGLTRQAAGCSHGLRPSRVSRRSPGRDSHPDFLPHALQAAAFRPEPTGVPESRSALALPQPTLPANQHAARGNPRRVPAPDRPDRSSEPPPGLCVHLRATSHITADRLTLFGKHTSLYRSRSGRS
jgi:hypothetical protein